MNSAVLPASDSSIAPRGLAISKASLISVIICLVVTVAFLLISPQTRHWFVVPVFLCGVVITPDAVQCIRGRLDYFDPISVLGLLGFHFFFLAPLLHVHLDLWMRYITPPNDWRPWVGYISVLNFLGLLVYRWSRGDVEVRNPALRGAPGPFPRTVWTVHEKLFPALGTFFLLLSLALQVWTYNRFGGVYEYMLAYSARGALNSPFEGFGRLFIFSECFPFVALLFVGVYAARLRRQPSWLTLGLFAVAFLLVALFFGGLRGSRSNVIWNLFWMAGIVHLRVRRLNRVVIIVGLAFLLAFMVGYGVYKGGGVEAMSSLWSGQWTVSELVQRTGRTPELALLRDFARTDVQAFLLYRYHTTDYRLALGRTYPAALARLIPESIWPNRPPGRIKEGSELIHGAYIPGLVFSTYIYGLSGETILNFGPIAVPLFFVFLGLSVRWTRKFVLGLHPDDTRRLLVPFLVNLVLLVLIFDSDNLLYFVAVNGAVPILVVLAGSQFIRNGLRFEDQQGVAMAASVSDTRRRCDSAGESPPRPT
jgi:hypothetical protein